MVPDRDLIIAVLTSIGGVSADSIEQDIAANLLGVEPPRPIDGEPPAFHAGRFDVGPFAVELAPRDGVLHLEAPPPVPRGRLVRIGAASYALDGDPWGVVLHLECAREQCPGIRLHMAGMEWPGRRIAP